MAKDTQHTCCLNLQVIEVVWSAEDLEKGESGMIALKWAVWCEGDELFCKVAYPMLKPECDDSNELGKIVKVDCKKLIRFVAANHGLT